MGMFRLKIKRSKVLVLATFVPLCSLILLLSMATHVINIEDEPTSSELLRLKRENAKLIAQISGLRMLQREARSQGYADEMVRGLPMHTEYDLMPFTRFTSENRLYLAQPGLGGRVIEIPIGHKRRELKEVLDFAISSMNKALNGTHDRVSESDFTEALLRTIPGVGTQYEVYFKDPQQPGRLRRIALGRQLSDPEVIEPVELVAPNDVTIHILMPLKGRQDVLQRFLNHLRSVCPSDCNSLSVTIALFGNATERAVTEWKLRQFERSTGMKKWRVIRTDGNFSRSAGLQIAADSLSTSRWIEPRENPLLFLCDVDILFKTDFLTRCRQHTKPGRRVYYPILFSMYNPNVVYALHGKPVPSLDQRLIISKESGFWRDFGYGMACMYHSDFKAVKGFVGDGNDYGWGQEDVKLYQKFVRSKILVIRATDHSIFHVWHPKYCDPELSEIKYRSCIRSKALNEGAHSQLGVLAFKREIDIHRSYRHHYSAGRL